MILCHRDNDVSFFVPLIHIAMRLDDLRQEITPVNNWPYVSRLNRPSDKIERRRFFDGQPEHVSLAASECSPPGSQVVHHHIAVGYQIAPMLLE